jgi:hypothetical protein
MTPACEDQITMQANMKSNMLSDITRAIMAVERLKPTKGTSMKEWNIAIEDARKAREDESRSRDNFSVKRAWLQANVYRIQLNIIRGENICLEDWKRTYEGVFIAVTIIRGVEMRMTPQELKDAPVPVDSKGAKRWGFRNIKVVRDNVPSTPRINNILSGGNKMLSATERADVNAAKSNIQKENNPKGTITITKLRRAIDAMHEITGLSKYLEFKFGIECRRNALIYRVIDDTDDTEKKYVADRVKSSGVSDGRANFNIPVGKVLQRLLDGQSQTFIAMDNRRKTVRAIWFLYGEDACEMLKKFDKNLIIQLGITPKNKSKNLFSNAFNSEKYRYNISEPAERERLLNAKIEFASVNNVNANRETEEFWNSDKSQM